MKVGVLVATYNGIKFIKEQLDSILNQTKKVDEIIISDDGSTDGTFEFLNEYADIHSDYNIVIVKNCGEHGATKNFENAYRNSTSDILFFADQDDAWKQDKVEVFIKAFEKYPECGLVFSDAVVTDDKLNSIEKTVWDYFFPDVRDLINKDDIYTLIDRDFLVKRIRYVNVVPGMCIAIKKEILKKTVPFNSVLIHDDIVMMYSAMHSRICCINKTESYYRQHENNSIGVNEINGDSENRRNSLSGLIKNTELTMKNVLYDYIRTEYFNELDKNGEYTFLRKQFKAIKKRFSAAKSNVIFALFKLFSVLIMSGYEKNKALKLFMIDVSMVIFVRKKKRIVFFKKYNF